MSPKAHPARRTRTLVLALAVPAVLGVTAAFALPAPLEASAVEARPVTASAVSAPVTAAALVARPQAAQFENTYNPAGCSYTYNPATRGSLLKWNLATDNCDHDTDGDWLPDIAEAYHGTSVTAADSDGDQWSDYYELGSYGTNPLNANSRP